MTINLQIISHLQESGFSIANTPEGLAKLNTIIDIMPSLDANASRKLTTIMIGEAFKSITPEDLAADPKIIAAAMRPGDGLKDIPADFTMTPEMLSAASSQSEALKKMLENFTMTPERAKILSAAAAKLVQPGDGLKSMAGEGLAADPKIIAAAMRPGDGLKSMAGEETPEFSPAAWARIFGPGANVEAVAKKLEWTPEEFAAVKEILTGTTEKQLVNTLKREGYKSVAENILKRETQQPSVTTQAEIANFKETLAMTEETIKFVHQKMQLT